MISISIQFNDVKIKFYLLTELSFTERNNCAAVCARRRVLHIVTQEAESGASLASCVTIFTELFGSQSSSESL